MVLLTILVAQWIKCPPGVWEVMGSIPTGDSDFFFVPRLRHAKYFIFHIVIIFIMIKNNIYTTPVSVSMSFINQGMELLLVRNYTGLP